MNWRFLSLRIAHFGESMSAPFSQHLVGSGRSLTEKIFTGGPISSKNNWCDDTAQVLRDLTRTQQPWESGAKKTSVNVSEHG